MRTIQNIILRFLPALLMPLLLISCLDEEVIGHTERANRTVLYYISNACLSDAEMQEKLESLVDEWTSDGSNYLLVYQEGRDGNASCLVRIRMEETIEEGIQTEKAIAEVVKTYDNTGFLPENVFARVLGDVTTLYPASDYGLILCTQCSGWLPDDTGITPRSGNSARSIAVNGSRKLELRRFASVIPDGQFRFILFEGDHTAGAEVAYELKDKTEYILASAAEIVSPGFTPVCDKLLTAIYCEEPRLAEFAADYYEYRNGLEGSGQSATVSVIRTSELAPLKALLRKAESRVEHWEYIYRREFQHFDRRPRDYLFYDLADYIRGIGNEEENARLTDMLSKAVVYQAATDRFLFGSENAFSIDRHCGLTIYVPVAQFTYLNEQRQKLKLFIN